MKRGAVDFLIKPFQLTQLARVIHAAVDQRRLREENAELRAQLRDRFRFDNIIGRDSTMQQLFSTLELVAPMNSTVLIQGETGTGKELIARTIHHHSSRADQKFVAFNAAAIPEEVRTRSGPAVVPTVSIPDEGINFTSVVSQLERELIMRCLEKTGGNKRQAARLLNLSRTTFIDKLHRLNLERGAA